MFYLTYEELTKSHKHCPKTFPAKNQEMSFYDTENPWQF